MKQNHYIQLYQIQKYPVDQIEKVLLLHVYFMHVKNVMSQSTKEIAEIFNLESTVMTKGCKKCQENYQMNKNE